MKTLTIGRILFALATIAFGAQYAITGHLVFGLPPLPPFLPLSHVLAYLAAIVLVGFGLPLLAGWQKVLAAGLLAAFYLFASLLHLFHLGLVVSNGDDRSAFLGALCLGAAALALAALLSSAPHTRGYVVLGRWLFAFSMIVFGIQHFMYATLIAGMVPAWMPFHHFWIIFTGVAFIVAGIALITHFLDKLAMLLLASMFFGWLILLHIPLCIAAPRSGDMWASLFTVVGLIGGSLIFAASCAAPMFASNSQSPQSR